MDGIWILVFFLFFVLGAVLYIIESIPTILQFISIAIIYFGMFFVLYKTFCLMDKKVRNKLYFFSYIVIILFWLLGPFYLIELIELDKTNVYMSVFGQNKIVRFLLSLVIVMVVLMGTLFLSCIFEYRLLQSVVCLLPSVFLFVFLGYSSKICAKSYSDNAVSMLSGNKNLVQYVVREDTKIYYTAWQEQRKDIYRFPIFSPVKYAPNSFKAGDVVYVYVSSWKGSDLHNGVFHSAEDNLLAERKYVKVTDGKRAGFIRTSALENSKE